MTHGFPIFDLDDGSIFLSGAATRCKSACCDFDADARHALISLKALEVAAFDAFKADNFDPLEFDNTETASGGWVQFEYGLAIILARAFKDRSTELKEGLKPYFTSENEGFDSLAFSVAAEELDADLRTNLRKDIEEPTRDLLRQAVLYGEASIAQGLLNGVTMVDAVVDALTTSTVQYSEEFFVKHVLPATYKQIEIALADPLVRPDLMPLFDHLSELLGRDAYWSLVANSNASRAFHYGLLRSAQIQGYTKATFSAVLDEKTSEICEELNGRVWRIADLVRKYEQASTATSTEELKQVAPWFKRNRGTPIAEDVRAYLVAGGVPCPPLHGRCRSTLRVF